MASRFVDSNGRRFDPLRGYKFAVDSEPIGIECGFQKVSGLSEESEVAEYRDGCDPVTMRKMPGLVTYENITLERGLSVGDGLLDWRKEVIYDIQETQLPSFDGSSAAGDFRRTLFIRLYDRGSPLVAREWKAIFAWPCSLNDGDLDSGSSDVVIQSCEICHEGLERVVATPEAVFFESGNRRDIDDQL